MIVRGRSPVHFKWQILDWELPEGRAQEIGLILSQTLPQQDSTNSQDSVPPLTKTDPPSPRTTNQGVTTRDFHGRKVDYSEVDSKRKDLGRAGELLVLEYERKHLIEAGREDLANKIIHTSEVIGDGAGYDTESFTIEGEKKYIEVKTTTGGINTPFLMSINEVTFSQQNSDNTIYIGSMISRNSMELVVFLLYQEILAKTLCLNLLNLR